MTRPVILVVCGLKREANLLRDADVLAIAGGGDAGALERRLTDLEPASLGAVVSFGLAGALDPAMRVGDIVVPGAVSSNGRRCPTSAALADPWRGQLAAAGLVLRAGDLVGVDAALLTPADKATARAATGADTVDMESHVAAAYAERHDLRFVALRVISDGADRALPPVAGEVMRPDGSIDLMRLTKGLGRHPGQIPDLIAAGRDAATAFRQLGRVCRLLGRGLGLHL